ncbi:hypothetical protein HLH36_15030 [Gluconacetobacter aggeris]|uniref:Uncharacterized protein n=1 Tax=Gluconacetobacter aggeris TaxID=1286186 RepID=A0A7W4NX85_9PROT|nr:hypothetical protein [Gluconacetobacter aggeris]MBB2169646.1 hypothetical protein [Gluconacetobacter aggeris]
MMLGLGIVLGFFGIGFLCWLLFIAAVYAAPLYVGAMTFAALEYLGVPGLLALMAGFVCGVAALVMAQGVLATSRDPAIRGAVSLALALPAALVGFSMTLGFCGLGGMGAIPEYIFAIFGALCVGGAAWGRLCATPVA